MRKLCSSDLKLALDSSFPIKLKKYSLDFIPSFQHVGDHNLDFAHVSYIINYI